MANTKTLDELVTHIVRVCTVTEYQVIEFAAYDTAEAVFLADSLVLNRTCYKVQVFDYKTGKKIYGAS